MSGIESGGSHPPELPPMTWGDPPSAAAGPNTLPSVPWGWWEPFFVFLLTFFTSGLLSVAIAAGLRGDIQKAMAVVMFELTLAFWTVLWVKLRFGLGVRWLGVRGDQIGRDLGFGLGLGVVGWGVSTLVVGNLVIRIVDALSKTPVTEPDQLDFANPSGLVLTITAVGVIVIAPIAEELFFRGFVFRGFRRSVGFALSACASGALFMLAHAPFWLIFPSIFTLGVVLAWGLERRASLVPAIVAHALFNAMGFVFYLTSLR